MAQTFEELVASSSRLVKKEWSSPSELAQELYSLLANSGVSSAYGTASKLITPVYAEVSTTTKPSYPENASSYKDNSKVDFQGLKNPTDPNYPEVPPLTVKQKLNQVDAPSTGNGGGGASNGSIDVRIDAAVAYGTVTASGGYDHAIPGRVDIQVIYSPTSSVLLKNIKVLNANDSFKVPVGAEVIVFFSAYALFPVWL
jgi:hypothetical protein